MMHFSTLTLLKKVLFLLLTVIVSLSIKAENTNDIKFLPLDSDGEMPSDICSFTFIDDEGFLWIGTEEGVVRYDGYETINLMSIVDNYSTNKVFNDVVEVGNGVLWFGTSTGLLKYDKKTSKITDINLREHLQNFNIARKVDAIVYDGKNSLWFGNPTGLFHYNLENDSISLYRNISGRKGVTIILDIIIDSKGTLWVSTWKDGLIRFDPKTKDHNTYLLFNDFTDQKKNNQVNRLFISKEGHLYAGSWGGGLYVLDIESGAKPKLLRKFYPNTTFDLANEIVTSINQNKNGNIWVGTPSGLSVIQSPTDNNTKVKIYNEDRNNPYAIGNNSIFSIQRDATGIMWLATRGGGVYKVNPERHLFELYSAPQSSHRPNTNRVIHSFIEDNKGNLLVGTQSQLLTQFSTTEKTFHPTNFPWGAGQFNTAKSFTWDKQGCLWLGLRYSGLLRYNPKNGKYFTMHNRNRRKKFFAQEVNAIKEDANHNLWAATNNGVYKVTLGGGKAINDFKVTAIKSSMVEGRTAISSNISDLLIDKDQHLWVATNNNGLLRTTTPLGLETEFIFEQYNTQCNDCGLQTDHLLSLFEDSDGRVWVGTGGDGLKYWDSTKKTFVAPNGNKQLRNIIFLDINEDDNKRIWATTNRGLYCFTKNNSGEYRSEIFSKVDGLQSNMFSQGAFYKMSDGRFAIGGPRGFNIFHPADISPDTYIPPVRITEVINNTTVLNPYLLSNGKTENFKHSQNDFSFSFSSLDFRHPEKNKYAYKLEGLDNEWKYVTSKSKTASYSNLPKGTYTFMVKGSNYMGVWSDAELSISFRIKQAPYKTWWAILIYITAITTLIIFYFRLRLTQVRTENKLELEKMERQKSDSLNQFKLQFFTNLSHELLTPLSVLKIASDQWNDYKNNKDVDLRGIIDRNVSYLRRQIQKTLQFRKVERGDVSLNIHEVDLPSLLTNISDNYKLIAENKKIDFQCEIPKHLYGNVDSEKVDIIVNNLLSNAFKYTDEGGQVSLSTDVLEKGKHTYIEISINDNGQGIPKEKLDQIFERFYRINQVNSKTEGLGIGLALANNLCEMHGGKIEVESKLGFGTNFKITLPISKQFYEDYQQDDINSFFDKNRIAAKEESAIVRTVKIKKDKEKNILILEDDADSLLLMRASISEYYNVLSASNGLEGMKIAGEQEVDLIVTDNMMPEMTGTELCKQLKSDMNTSHIPIILVTADQQEDMRFSAYEAGVDSILIKPLNINILLTRISALLKKKEGAIKVFKKGDLFEPSELVITTMDEKFLDQLKSIVEAHIEDPDLSVKLLMKELGLSQSQLYRKMNGILDVTPNDYIKNIRLRRAAKLIEADKNLNISDVAFKFGFNDLSYFGVCFKKQFGVAPRNYQKGDRREE